MRDSLTAEIGELIDERLRAKSFTTELRTLSGVVAEQGLERIDLLKINVEKSELDVLQGISPGDWLKIQNGGNPATGDAFDPTPRYIRNMRDFEAKSVRLGDAVRVRVGTIDPPRGRVDLFPAWDWTPGED